MAIKETIPGSIEWLTKAEKPVAKIIDEGEEAGGQNTLSLESGCNTASIEMAGAVKVATWGLEAPSQERVEKTLLQKKGLSDFLQLAKLGDLKINCGSATVEWPGGNPLATELAVSHGLGRTPIAVGVWSYNFAQTTGAGNFTTTTFNTKLRAGDGSSPAKGSKEKVTWVAIG